MRVSRNSKLLIPYLERFYDSSSYYSYTLIRFVAGAMMVPHGYIKLFVNLDGTVDFEGKIVSNQASTVYDLE